MNPLTPFVLAGMTYAGFAHAAAPMQTFGEPLNLAGVELEEIYSNDFSGDDAIDFEKAFISDGKRSRMPYPAAEWVAEGYGGAEVCEGRLHVAPVSFDACGVRSTDASQEPSHMVVWNKNRFPSEMMFEFTVNHHGSDNGLTLLFFAAMGKDGQDIFDLSLPPREGVYRNYNKGELRNYTDSYFSRNKKPSLVLRGEAYSNRVRKNPGANIIATNSSQTHKCNDCDYRVRILKLDGDITVAINDVVVNKVVDTDPHGGGYIGLRNMMGVDRVSYDDFKVFSARSVETSSVAAAHDLVSDPQSFVTRLKQARRGEEIIIKNGVYRDWSVEVEVHGQKDKPVRILPESKGGVTFTADKLVKNPMMTFKGGYFSFEGFVFRNIEVEDTLLMFEATKGARFLNNDLSQVHGVDEIPRLVQLRGLGADNVFAGNTMHDCDNIKGITVRQEDDGISKRTHIHHNVFKDLNINRGGEGTSTLQLASNGRHPYDQLLAQAVVEHNYFENIAGDAETISNKSNENIIRNNTFLNTKSLVIRQGHNVRVEDNVLVKIIGPAVRVHGSGHTVSGNTIKYSETDGIALVYGLGSGLEVRTHRVTATNGHFTENIIENAGANGIFLGHGKGLDYSGHKNQPTWNTGVVQDIPPSGNVITGNLIKGSKLAAIETAGATDNIIRDNTILD